MNDIKMQNILAFSDEEINSCKERGGLLSIELEFTRRCNLRCLYCYSSAGESRDNELTLNEIKDVILQAKALGVRKVILLGGGEPLLYSGVFDIIDFINSQNMQQVLFTNGLLIDRDTAHRLFNMRIPVVIKHNSFKADVQDYLAGITGAYEKIQQGLNNLLEAGYPDSSAALGIQTIVCNQNKEEIPDMWRWARSRGIIPYFEMLTIQGRAKQHEELYLDISEVKRIFDELRDIDEREFGINWKSHPTIAAFSCKRHYYSCLINSTGGVQPCTGVDLEVGNIREKPLAEIIRQSEVIKRLRNIDKNITGHCRDCEYTGECYGCRGNAFQITGSYLASDPTCWYFKYSGRDSEAPEHCSTQHY